MICDRPLDSLDLEAVLSGEPAPGARDAASHLEGCPDCARRLRAFREMDLWLADLPAVEVGPELASRVLRLRAFSSLEKRSLRLWWPPALLFFGLLSGSSALLSVPMLTGAEQAGILTAIPATLGLEWRALLGVPVSVWRALPGSVSAISEVLALERGFAALSILVMLPAGYSLARLWMRRSSSR